MQYMRKWLGFVLLNFVLMANASAEAVKDFALIDTAGKIHKLSQYKGKWVVVNYWATWCGPCLQEVPDLVGFYESHHGRDAMVLGVTLEYESASEVTDFVGDMLMTYPVILGDNQSTGQVQHPDVLPTTYIYNPNGELVKIKRGALTRQYLDNIIKQSKK